MKEIVAFFRGFRIFSNLRSVIIEHVFERMKQVQFIRGQKVYIEGSSTVDGLYFIQDGEFEITQKLNIDKTKIEQKPAKKVLSRTIQVNLPKKEAGLLQTRSRILLSKIDGTNCDINQQQQTKQADFLETAKASLVGCATKTLPLVILGKNEIFGLEEIVEDCQQRQKTVTCLSKHGKCYFIDKSEFVQSVNQFRYSQAVIEE